MRKQGKAYNTKAFWAIRSISTFSEGGNKKISLSAGERILLRSNNKTLGVRNGDLATITAINVNEILAQLDSGEKLIIPKTYKHIEYGYALTVHKSQGMTVEKASVLIDSKYWDKNLSFVAMTRHRDKLSLYADKANHPDLKALYQTLSRAKTKDNVIDWPLDYAIRAGFDPDKLIERAINSIAGMGQKIKHTWNYLVHYEAYLRTQKTIANRYEREKQQQQLAKEVADYFESKSLLKTGIQQFEKEAKTSGSDKFQSPTFDSLYKETVELNKKAYDLYSTLKNQAHSTISQRLKEDSQRRVNRANTPLLEY